MAAGQVTADGLIETTRGPDGSRRWIKAGKVYVAPDQAKIAQRYGWCIIGQALATNGVFMLVSKGTHPFGLFEYGTPVEPPEPEWPVFQ